MKATKIFVQNDTTAKIYVQAYAEDGVFLIVICAHLPLGLTESVPPGKAATYKVNAAVQACIGRAGLTYDVFNKMNQKIRVSSRRDEVQKAFVLHVTVASN